ncbi:MAG TPA: SHOCT domain-containing protein, partial [Candidatus Dormibacteraeota bacterium]|nr:SHOCT domain-containing protein [Candidatus Dormibacteraeota bacterium]
ALPGALGETYGSGQTNQRRRDRKMMWYRGYGQGWPWAGALVMLAFWAGFFILAGWIVRTYARPHPHSERGLDTLRRRLASGEITLEEFERTRKVLQG